MTPSLSTHYPLGTGVFQILIPQQESIKASRGRGGGGGGISRLNGFLERKNTGGPHFAIVIVRAKVTKRQETSTFIYRCFARISCAVKKCDFEVGRLTRGKGGLARSDWN